MYEMFSALAHRLGAPYARKLATASMRVAGAFESKPPVPALQRSVMGLAFPSPVGLAAGFDKTGALYPALPGLGLGFAEIGSVIPRPEPGRSPGLAAVIRRLSRYAPPHPIPLGVSISMNRTTPVRQMPTDYLECYEKLRGYADYITLNLGVRAGPDLHLTENRAVLRAVFSAVARERWALTEMDGRKVPILVKVDQGRGDTARLVECVCEYDFDGLVLSGESKGGKGHPVAMLEQVVRQSGLPVISVGGIRNPQDAQARLNAGAILVQVYTGVVQKGPRWISEMNNNLLHI